MQPEPKPNTNRMMALFMDRFESFTEDEKRVIWQDLNAIVDSAKLSVVEDAEKAIAKLRIFSL